MRLMLPWPRTDRPPERLRSRVVRIPLESAPEALRELKRLIGPGFFASNSPFRITKLRVPLRAAGISPPERSRPETSASRLPVPDSSCSCPRSLHSVRTLTALSVYRNRARSPPAVPSARSPAPAVPPATRALMGSAVSTPFLMVTGTVRFSCGMRAMTRRSTLRSPSSCTFLSHSVCHGVLGCAYLEDAGR